MPWWARRRPVRRVSSQATRSTSRQDAQGPQGNVLEVADGGRDDYEGQVLAPQHTYSPEEGSRASAAAPRTPDSGPRVASLISARSREGGRARRYTSSAGGLQDQLPAATTPPPTATTSGLKMLTKPASPMPSHRPASSSTERATSSPPSASEARHVLTQYLSLGGQAAQRGVRLLAGQLAGAAAYGGAGGERLEAAAVSAGAAGAGSLDRHVAQLAARALSASQQDAVRDHTTPHPRA